MNMFWNRKPSSQWGSAAVVHMLRAATIAAVVSSCSTSPSRDRAVLAEAEEPPPPPLVMLLDPELAAAIKNYASNAYQELSPEDKSAYPIKELQNVFVTTSYIDENNQERLLLLALTVPNPNNTRKLVNRAALRLPLESGGPGNFKDDFADITVSYSASPVTTFSCGALSSGGTRYCNF